MEKNKPLNTIEFRLFIGVSGWGMQKQSKVIQDRRSTSILAVKKKSERLFSFSWSSTIAFAVFCFVFYSYAAGRKSEICLELQAKIRDLEMLKQSSLEEREDLVLQMASQNDRDWIEMILKKRLGVVPEGQMKVYFKKDE